MRHALQFDASPIFGSIEVYIIILDTAHASRAYLRVISVALPEAIKGINDNAFLVWFAETMLQLIYFTRDGWRVANVSPPRPECIMVPVTVAAIYNIYIYRKQNTLDLEFKKLGPPNGSDLIGQHAI